MLIAIAGRRIDAANANDQRFPLANVDMVRGRIAGLLREQTATALVCAAACGADLIALEEAGKMGLRRRVVLPSARERFRETSVVDRPGDWGPVYDRVLDEVEAAGDLLVKPAASEDDYAAGNLAILDEAVSLAKDLHVPAKAALVWDGKSRGKDDITELFGEEARGRGLAVIEVGTL